MYPYLERKCPDDSGIMLEYYDRLADIRYLKSDDSVEMHQHEYYEMVLILRGSCQHHYRGSYTPLIPGDLFIVPPHQPHSYRFRENIALCNCQFSKEVLTSIPEKFITDIEYVALQQQVSARKRLQDIQAFDANNAPASLKHVGDINSQGIIHLDRAERELITAEFFRILKEQDEKKLEFERAKKLMLENVLIQIKRIQVSQFENNDYTGSWKDEMVDAVMNMIESDISKDYDFNEIARTQNITISYFRSIFKSVTGLSPIEYLNRVRMLRALELLQTTPDSISEIAEQVGIYDANYFSRLFKKVIGYPPRYFKSIGE